MTLLSSSAEYVLDLDYARGHLPDFLSNGGSMLITGSTGLIGSFIVDCILRHNECEPLRIIEVTCLSRSIDKLKSRFGTDPVGISYLESDVCNVELDGMAFDCVLHLASNADPNMYALYPVETITGNVIGTYRLLDWQRRACPAARFFLASTMEVYGEKKDGSSFSECDYGLIDFNSIRSGYPESKRVSELLCSSYSEEYGLETRIGRLGYIYGPTMTDLDSKVVAQFIRSALALKPIELKSLGTQKRSYCYVADAVSAIFTLLDKGSNGEAYNISNMGSVTTIAGLADCVASSVDMHVVSAAQTDLEKKGSSPAINAVLSHEKLSELGWSPKYSLSDGIARTINVLASCMAGE